MFNLYLATIHMHMHMLLVGLLTRSTYNQNQSIACRNLSKGWKYMQSSRLTIRIL